MTIYPSESFNQTTIYGENNRSIPFDIERMCKKMQIMEDLSILPQLILSFGTRANLVFTGSA